jgi:diguanylate cyclase (GGDEF)-like protein/PAS domain S-box-containing protein
MFLSKRLHAASSWSPSMAAGELRARVGRLWDPRLLARLGLGLVVVMIPALVFWGAWANYQVGTAARRASGVSDAFEQARYAIGMEGALERKYRSQPRADTRRAHAQAGAGLVMWLQRARELDPAAGAGLVEGLITSHKLYLASAQHVFNAVDALGGVKAEARDDGETAMLFEDMRGAVFKAAAEQRAVAMHKLDDLVHVQFLMLCFAPPIFGFGLWFAFLFLRMLRRHRRQSVAALAAANLKNEQRFRSLVRNATEVILICDAAGNINYQAPTAETDWGFATSELFGQKLADLIHPADQPVLWNIWQQICAQAGSTQKVELRSRDGAGAWRYGEFIFTNLLHESFVGGVVATARDISERKTFEQQLTTRAFYDSLTSLPNRALLSDRIEQALARGRRRVDASIGVIFIDLDNFKKVNDSLGHQAGDALLVIAASRLLACVRPSDTVARLGGDEFVILLDQLTAGGREESALVANRILKQFERPFSLEGSDYYVSASLGIALADAGDDKVTSHLLLRDADVAMYRAKSGGGGNYVMFDVGMQIDVRGRLDLETDLRHAIERDELRLQFQPIVQLPSIRLQEVEALLRWQHPTRGWVMPADFISIAEETGLIIPIGLWVLEHACRQLALWQTEFPRDPPLQLSVNLSPRQFEHPDLIVDVQQALGDAGVEPSSLKLEITEGIVMRDTESSILTLRKFKNLGIRIAIDDFGTGYSSLSHLRRLPLDVLKIDRSFIQGIGGNDEDNAIVQAIISMAKALGLAVTAEGVETPEQLALLQAWSCDRAQGYLFSRPLNARALTNLLRAPNGVAHLSKALATLRRDAIEPLEFTDEQQEQEQAVLW